ncbi:DUF885 domain-containing protein [Archangium lansingense]|uniref:DUF885 domain-containing protein n=1 Tax=Archangium lansingense TaxID=2995310 RepID=A0ABT3ZUV8_9BACT|nr:DUF885 domain-containing protein [Archangium lansinium]MCY1073091.1 DUF885 domain-containing protein [Archangium lansinium]
MLRATLCCAALLLVPACAPRTGPGPAASASAMAPTPADAEYARFAREFLDWYYAAHPVRSTNLGLHQYDSRLQDMSAEAFQRQARELHGWLARLARLDRAALTGDAVFDVRILENAIRAELLELEEARGWRRNPMLYNSAIASALSSLSQREFAPVEERVRSLMARMERIPEVVAAAKANLRDVPKPWAEQGLRDTRGTVGFLRSDLPKALEAQGLSRVDATLREAFSAALARTTAEVEGFVRWQEQELLPKAHGDFRLGKALFEKKLALEEHVELTAEQLRDINERAIREYQQWVAKEAARVDAMKSPVEVMDALVHDHPTAEELIPTARKQLEECQRFVAEKGLLTLPSERLPTVRETPPYARMGFASMDTPGPFETRATEAFYNITNVDSEWTGEQKAQHLTYFNRAGLLGITVHEGMPGHFVQLLYEARIPTEVRKVFTPASLVEGWAHYVEQMMVDEGFGGGDPAVRLGQLRRALQRHARWHAGLSMHAFGESVEGAAKRYAEIAYFEPFPALREVQRGTFNPTYLYYALGRMQILKLREDYKRYLEARGQTFSLRDFHDRFLQLGLPVSLARQALMPGDMGPSLE